MSATKTLLQPSREIDRQVHTALNRAWPEDRCPVCGWPYAPDAVSGCVRGNCSRCPVPARRADEVPEYTANLAQAAEALEAFIESHPTSGVLLIGPDPVPNGRYYCSVAFQGDEREPECEGASMALAISGALIEAAEIAKEKAAA